MRFRPSPEAPTPEGASRLSRSLRPPPPCHPPASAHPLPAAHQLHLPGGVLMHRQPDPRSLDGLDDLVGQQRFHVRLQAVHGVGRKKPLQGGQRFQARLGPAREWFGGCRL
eukprot:scaffold13456_cov115-Isochrysis_galbana.AAC.1